MFRRSAIQSTTPAIRRGVSTKRFPSSALATPVGPSSSPTSAAFRKIREREATSNSKWAHQHHHTPSALESRLLSHSPFIRSMRAAVSSITNHEEGTSSQPSAGCWLPPGYRDASRNRELDRVAEMERVVWRLLAQEPGFLHRYSNEDKTEAFLRKEQQQQDDDTKMAFDRRHVEEEKKTKSAKESIAASSSTPTVSRIAVPPPPSWSAYTGKQKRKARAFAFMQAARYEREMQRYALMLRTESVIQPSPSSSSQAEDDDGVEPLNEMKKKNTVITPADVPKSMWFPPGYLDACVDLLTVREAVWKHFLNAHQERKTEREEDGAAFSTLGLLPAEECEQMAARYNNAQRLRAVVRAMIAQHGEQAFKLLSPSEKLARFERTVTTSQRVMEEQEMKRRLMKLRRQGEKKEANKKQQQSDTVSSSEAKGEEAKAEKQEVDRDRAFFDRLLRQTSTLFERMVERTQQRSIELSSNATTREEQIRLLSRQK